MRLLQAVIALITLTIAATAFAQSDPVGSQLLAPGRLLQHRKRLGLSDAQANAIRELAEEAAPLANTLQRDGDKAAAELQVLLAKDQIDEAETLAQFTKMQAIRHAQQSHQLRTMIRIRNQLTARQQRLAQQLIAGRPKSTPVAPKDERTSERIADLPRESYEQTLARIKELKEEDVAWRKIPWRTCLLEGLAESKKQGKPIILWIFIDRPIDDERC